MSKIKQTKDVEGIKIFTVTGDFNMETTPELQKICSEAAKNKGTRAVLLDFTSAGSVDTAAFACMINFIKDHKESGIRIGIINLENEGKNFMEILKLEKAIQVFRDEEEAILEFKKPNLV
ncbi:MAG: STAS domain-containing protein [Candidatus Aadella gelida]|nr:STAS domain-containing protein [Candidatus Aadella gelida]